MLSSIYLLVFLGSYCLTPQEIMDKVDENMVFTTARYDGKMSIYIGSEVRIKTYKAWAKGRDKAFMIFSNPEDKNTRYLKREGSLWIYFAEAEEIVKISGHMLRESMMGSDLSYEDALENEKLKDRYTVEDGGNYTIKNTPCYLIILTAKKNDLTYYKRKVWVEKQRFVAIREERYSRAGKMLRLIKIEDIIKTGKRYYPTKVYVQNTLRSNSYTYFEMINPEFDIELSESIFSRANLKP